jgi:uncharacterized protein (DUF4415 family)
MFSYALLVRPDTREDYGEERWIGIGRRRAELPSWYSRHLRAKRSASSRSERQIMKSAKNMKRRSRTDWKRIDAMRDEDIDYSDIPKQGPDFFANAILWPGPKKQITLRLDPDVLKFFRKHGRGYQSTINAVLRKYMEARKESTSVKPRTSADQRVNSRRLRSPSPRPAV